MKKQFLTLTLFVLALFAGITNSYGQALPGSSPRGIACVDDQLHPIAGKKYTYEVATDPASGNQIWWWATKDADFITLDTDGTTRILNTSTALTATSGELLAAGTNYNVATADATSVDITWTDALLADTQYQGTVGSSPSPTFVAAYVSGACSDNLKVFEINPIEAFTVDIINYENSALTALGWDIEDDQCIDEVSSATYNSTSHEMEYEYGWNTFVYEVIAANFTDYYVPTFEITGLGDSQTALIEWTYTAPANWDGSEVFYSYTGDPTLPVETSETSTNGGVSIYVKVTITNNQFENNATDQSTGIDITLAVDGQNSVGTWDVDNWDETTLAVSCTPTTGPDQEDKAVQTLLPRPAVTEGTTSATAPTGLLPGNETNTVTP